MNNKLKDYFPYCSEAVNQQKQKYFEVLLNERIVNTIKSHSLLRKLAHIKYDNNESEELANEFELNSNNRAAILPKFESVPMQIEASSTSGDDSICLPYFNMSKHFDIPFSVVEENRVDLLDKSVSDLTSAIIKEEQDCLFRLLVPIATTCNKTFLKFSVLDLNAIKKIAKSFKEDYKMLTDLVVSVYEYNYLGNKNVITFKDDEDIEYNIKIHYTEELGRYGKYTINKLEETEGYRGVSIFSLKEGKFQNYLPENPNMMSYKTYEAVKALKDDGNVKDHFGETQIYALSIPSKKESPIKVSIKSDFVLYPDPSMHKIGLLGYYGWEEIGVGLLESRDVKMVIIDRS